MLYEKTALVIAVILLATFICACGAETPIPTAGGSASATQVRVTFCEADTKTVYSTTTGIDSPITIGRSDTSDIVVSDEHVSRTHCKLTLIDSSLFVEDMDSTNGTFLMREQELAEVSEPTEISIGDVLILADVYLTLESIE